jgi:hypothetical protein
MFTIPRFRYISGGNKMPVQTTKDANVYFPDGAKVSIKEYGAETYTDLGVIMSAINMTFNFTENIVNSANAGELQKQIKDPTVDGSFTLGNLNNSDLVRLSSGLFTEVTTAGDSVESIDDQTILSGAATDVKPYNLVITETDGDNLKVSADLVIASVTGATDGPLDANDDYTIVDDPDSSSLKSIVFNTAGTNLTTLAQVITIAYTSVTPVASSTIYCGSSATTLNASAIKVTHTNSDDEIDREFEVFSADPTSGGFVFGFKGANEEGVEEMPISFRGKIDTSLTDGRQLFRYYTKTVA